MYGVFILLLNFNCLAKQEEYARFNMHSPHYAPKGYFRMGYVGYGRFFDFSFGRTNLCNETAFEILDDNIKYLCVTNSTLSDFHKFSQVALFHDMKSRKLLKIRLSRIIPSEISRTECIEEVKSLAKNCEYWYNIKIFTPINAAADAKHRRDSGNDTISWIGEDDSFLIKLSILFDKKNKAYIELFIESKKVINPFFNKMKREKDVLVEMDM